MKSDVSRSRLNRRQALRSGLLIGAGLLAAGAAALTPTAAAAAGYGWQEGWRFCSKCKGFFYVGFGNGRCPAGGGHNGSTSYHYYIWYDDDGVTTPGPHFQPHWRYCRKCQGLAYAGLGAGWCPGTGRHDHTGSSNYHIYCDLPPWTSAQGGWRYCHKCQGMFFGGYQNSSWCPESGKHEAVNSSDYVIEHLASAGADAATTVRRPG